MKGEPSLVWRLPPPPEGVVLTLHVSSSFLNSCPPQEKKRVAFLSWLRKPVVSSTAMTTSTWKIPGKHLLEFGK